MRTENRTRACACWHVAVCLHDGHCCFADDSHCHCLHEDGHTGYCEAPLPQGGDNVTTSTSDLINLELHRRIDADPCATACTHHLTPEWTLLGLANVAARAEDGPDPLWQLVISEREAALLTVLRLVRDFHRPHPDDDRMCVEGCGGGWPCSTRLEADDALQTEEARRPGL